MAKIVIGVMGPGDQATQQDRACAYRLGVLIAEKGWVLLTGGRNTGVMAAACRGAKAVNGLTLGILPGDHWQEACPAVDIPIVTGLGNARNTLNALSSRVVIACGLGTGTLSEIALALKAKRSVILLNAAVTSYSLIQSLAPEHVHTATTPDEAIARTAQLLASKH